MDPFCMVRNLAYDLAEFIFPRCCHLCGSKLSEGEEFVCPVCLSRLPRTLYHRSHMNPMEQRFAGIFPFVRATGHFFYASGSDLSILMQDLKYRHFKGMARFLGSVVGRELLMTPFLTGIDGVMPVPMHFLKKARRGYNQTEEIGIGFSDVTGIPLFDNLKAVRPHRTQTSLSIEERRRNTDGIFSIKNSSELEGKHILVLDDVCTTGSTLISAASALQDSCVNAKISLLTVGVTF